MSLRFRIVFFALINMIYSISGFSQSDNLWIQTDRNLYATGETVWGKVIFNNVNASGKMCKLIISDTSETTVYSCFFVIKNNIGDFYYTIPYTLAHGYYQASVLINDTGRQKTICSIPFTVVNAASDLEPDISYNATLNKDMIANFENVELLKHHTDDDISVSYDIGNKDVRILSVNVIDLAMRPYPNIAKSRVNISQNDIDHWYETFFIEGRATEGKRGKALPIMGFYNIEEDRFYFTKSNNEGHFTFKIDTFSATKQLQFVPYIQDQSNVLIKLKNEVALEQVKYIGNAGKGVLEFYNEAQLRQKVMQYFKTNLLIKPGISTRNRQDFKPQKKYIPSNFVKFDFMHQFCKENNVPILFKLKDDKFYSELLIPGQYAKEFNALSYDCLFIVNGLPTKNYDKIARIKTADIESIELYYDLDNMRKNYSVFANNGLVRMKTRTDLDIQSKMEKEHLFEVNGFQTWRPSVQDAILFKIKNNIRPIFESTLYWSTQDMDKIVISKSDDRSGFVAIIVYLDKDQKLKAGIQDLGKIN